MRQGSKEQSTICCSSVRLVVRNMILAGDRSRWTTGFTSPWVIRSARSTAFPTAATIWVVSPPEASCGSKGQRLLEQVPRPLHEDERVVLARSIAIDARKSAQVRDSAQMTVLLEQRGGVGQVRSRLLGGAIRGLAGKDGVVLGQLDGKDLAARVGRSKHVSDIAAVAVCRLKNQRHKPALGIILGAGSTATAVSNVSRRMIYRQARCWWYQGVPSFGWGRVLTPRTRLSIKAHDRRVCR